MLKLAGFALFFLLAAAPGKGYCNYSGSSLLNCLKVSRTANIRQDSTVNSAILGKAKEGEILPALKEKYGWYKVILPRRFKAYVYAALTEAKGKYLQSKVERLNIRLAPGKTAPVIGTMPKNKAVAYIRRRGKWYEIYPFPFAYGWIDAGHTSPAPDNSCRFLLQTAAKQESPKANISSNPVSAAFIGEGILQKIRPSASCPANYAVKNNSSRILLKIEAAESAQQLLGKKVKIWGKVKQNPCIYIDTAKIEAAE